METGIKFCTKCDLPKPLDDFRSRFRRGRWFHESQCKECATQHVVAYNKAHPQDAGRRAWESTLRNGFNMTPEQYGLVLDEQGGMCAICGRLPGARTNTKRRLVHFHVDHDHGCCPAKKSCGKCIRGLLCGPCNQFLGLIKESVGTARRIVLYLRGENLTVDAALEPVKPAPHALKTRKSALDIPDAIEGVPSKTCSKCKHPKPVPDGFHKCRSAKDGLQGICRDCFRRYQRENGKARYLSQLLGILKRRGLSVEKHRAMETAQRGRCLLCEQPPVLRRLDIDHCHVTDGVRGLLCNKCNQAIGLVGDNPNLVARAMNYLKSPTFVFTGNADSSLSRKKQLTGNNTGLRDFTCPDCGTEFKQVTKGVYGGHRRFCLHYSGVYKVWLEWDGTVAEFAEKYGIARATVYNWKNERNFVEFK